jgi:hypothetical protein
MGRPSSFSQRLTVRLVRPKKAAISFHDSKRQRPFDALLADIVVKCPILTRNARCRVGREGVKYITKLGVVKLGGELFALNARDFT